MGERRSGETKIVCLQAQGNMRDIHQAWISASGWGSRQSLFPLPLTWSAVAGWASQMQTFAMGGVPCAVRAPCEKLAVLHHREFGSSED